MLFTVGFHIEITLDGVVDNIVAHLSYYNFTAHIIRWSTFFEK